MPFRQKLSSTAREKLWDRVCEEQNRQWPLCNLCSCEVGPGQRWDASHFPVPHAFHGTAVGIAHSACNRRHGAKVVTPAFAKSNRVRQRHIGARVAANPMGGGRDDRLKKKLDGAVVLRATGERA